MPAEREAIRAALKRKGFRPKQSDHDYYILFVDGKKTSVRTKLSHGSKYKVYSDDLLGLVCKQLHLTKKDLLALIECSLEYATYAEMLKQQGIVRLPDQTRE